MNDELNALFGTISISLVAESPSTETGAPQTSVDEISSTLGELAFESTEANNENSNSPRTSVPTISKTEDLLAGLRELAFGTTAPKVLAAVYDRGIPQDKYLSSEEELNSDSDRSDVLVTSANFRQNKPGTTILHRIVKTIPRPPGEEIIIPLDESPAVLTSAAELEILKTKPFQSLVASKHWLDMEKKKASWKTIEEGRAPLPPTTPLMGPLYANSNPNTAEKEMIDMPMDFEDFSPLQGRAATFGAPIKESPVKALGDRPANVHKEVDIELRVEPSERDLNIEVEMTETQPGDEDEDEGEESDSSVEFILDSQNPVKDTSTTQNGWLARRRPIEECEWSHEYRVKYGRGRQFRKSYTSEATSSENFPPLGSGGAVAGTNYALANASNYTLGDTSAYQRLNASTETFKETARPGENSSAKKGKKKATPRLNEAGDLFFPKTQRGKGSKGRQPSGSGFEDLTPFKKGKGPAKTKAKPPKPQAVVPPNSASGLPEDEVDYDDSTAESEMSIDFNSQNMPSRDRTTSSGPVSPQSSSSESRKRAAINMASSPTPSPSAHRKEKSWANIASSPANTVSSPKPVRNLLAPNSFTDPVISSAQRNPIQLVLRQNMLRKYDKQKGALSYASIAASPTPAAATARAPSYSAAAKVPGAIDDEPKPTDLTASALSAIKAAKKPAPVAATASLGSAVSAGPSRSPFSAPATAAAGSGLSTAAASVTAPTPDPWQWGDTAPRTYTSIGGYQVQTKKKNKRKTGKNTVYEPVNEKMMASLPLGNMRHKVVGANYVGEPDEEEEEESNIGDVGDGFTTVAKRGDGGKGKGRAGETAGSASRSSGSSSVHGSIIGESGAGKRGGGRGMGDVQDRGGSSKTPRGRGSTSQSKGKGPETYGAGETWG